MLLRGGFQSVSSYLILVEHKLLSLIVLHAIKNRTPDPNHYYRRGYTHQYRAKKRVVFYFWLVSLLSMLIVPSIGFVTSAALFTTFLSFSFLDEGFEREDQNSRS